jgi:Tfp pilus assembly protein PilV
MAVLKKIKSATLIEVLVATVLIVVIFVVASLVLNNLLQNTFSKNTHDIENRLSILDYQIQNKLLNIPYQENYKGWTIEIKETTTNDTNLRLIMTATNKENGKFISKNSIKYNK